MSQGGAENIVSLESIAAQEELKTKISVAAPGTIVIIKDSIVKILDDAGYVSTVEKHLWKNVERLTDAGIIKDAERKSFNHFTAKLVEPIGEIEDVEIHVHKDN